MSKHCYLVVPDAFVQQHQGTQNGANIIGFAKDNHGRNLISLNAVNEFPDIFSTYTEDQFPPPVWLDAADFPQPEPETESPQNID